MALKNIFNILVDLKIVRSINQPLVTQNDSVVFILEVMDNGVPFDLTDTTTMSLAHTRRDGTVVVTNGTKVGNIATFELGTNETAVAGGVIAKAQFYDADGRVSTLSFGYQVGVDPTGSGYVPSETEQTLIQVVMADAQAKIDELSAVDVVELSQQLADKLNIGEVSVNDIDKTRGKFDQTYMTDEFIQQIAGTAPVNAIPANYSITPKQMAFSPVRGNASKNLFDKLAVTPDKYVVHTTGLLADNASFTTSDYIPVLPNTTYYKTENTSHAIYDSNKVYITGQDLVRAITTPANAAYVRITVRKINLEISQLEKGASATTYESFVPKLNKESIPQKTISKEMLDFTPILPIQNKNLFNKVTVITDSYIDSSTGVLNGGSPSYVASDFIPVQPNTTYSKVDNAHYAIYDVNKVYITGQDLVKTFTTPANAAYVRLTVRKINLDIEQFEIGSLNTSYEKYGFALKYEELPPQAFSFFNNNEVKIDIQLPSDIYLVSGESFHVYYNNIIKYSQAVRRGNYYVAHKLVGANIYTRKGIGYDYKWEYTPSAAETFQMEFMVFETYTKKKVASKIVTFTAKDSALVSNHGRTANIVTIGDSFLDLYKVSSFFWTNMVSKGGGNVPNMIGTRPISFTTPPAYDDAIAGWTYDWFINLASYGANTNPFFNPATSKFDFSYYMAQRFPTYTPAGQAGEHVDAFINMLGLNDAIWEGFNETTARANVQFIIDSVRAYDPAIKIILNTITPQPLNDDFLPNTNNYVDGGSYEKSKWNQEQWNAMMLSFHNPANSIWVLPSAAHFDTRNGLISVTKNTDKFTTGFTEVVETEIHPNDSGAKWIADSMYQAAYNLILR